MENKVDKKTGCLEKWAPFILFAVVTIIYSFRFFEPGKMIFGHDFVLSGQYIEALTNKILRGGDFPFWDPYILSGVPHFSSLNAPIFYPTYFLYPLFNYSKPFYDMFEYMLCIFLSGSFMYLYAKNIGLSKISSFLTGLFFMFSGSITILINAGHTINIQAIAYIPLIFYFFDKGIQKEKLIYFILTGCFLSMQCFSIGFQIMAYTCVLLFLYLLFKIVFENKSYKLIGSFFVTVIIVPLISAVQFIPTYYYNKLSYRAAPTYEYFVSWSYYPRETINFLLPRFFGFMEQTYWGGHPFRITSEYFGILPVILAFLSVAFLIKDKRVLCFTILSFITLLLSFGGHTPLYKILYHIPVISSFRNPGRWIAFFTFTMVILSGFGVDFLLDFAAQKYKKENLKQINKVKIILIALSVCFLTGWAWISLNSVKMTAQMQTWEPITKRFGFQNAPYMVNSLYKMIVDDMFRLTVLFSLAVITIYLVFINKFNKYLLTGCLLILFLADIWYIDMLAVKVVPFNKPDIRQEETINFLQQDNSIYRVLPLNGFSSENWVLSAKIQSVKGYTIGLKDYYEAMNNYGIFNNINFLNLLNVKYLLTTQAIDYPVLKLVYDRNIKIYQNLVVLPRAYLFNKVEVNKNKSEYLKKLMSPDFNIKENLIINEDFDEKLDSTLLNGDEVNITEYHANHIKIEVKNPGNSVLFLSEVYYPEWKAKVDGKAAKIYQANGLFRAVYLTKGTHQVEFYYSPKLLYMGITVSIISILSIIIFGIRYKYYNNSSTDKKNDK